MARGGHSVVQGPGSAWQSGIVGEELSLAPLQPRERPAEATSTETHALQGKSSWESWNNEANKP